MAKRGAARLWIKIVLPGAGMLGPGKVDLLRRIRKHRSLAGAARSMDMSYRRAWLLVDELNGLFELPLVDKWHGGRSQGGAALTEFGEAVVKRYDTLLAQAHRVNRDLLRDLGAAATTAGPRRRIASPRRKSRGAG